MTIQLTKRLPKLEKKVFLKILWEIIQNLKKKILKINM